MHRRPGSVALVAGAALLSAAPLGSGRPTPYARFGDWFGWACLALSLALILRSLIPRPIVASSNSPMAASD